MSDMLMLRREGGERGGKIEGGAGGEDSGRVMGMSSEGDLYRAVGVVDRVASASGGYGAVNGEAARGRGGGPSIHHCSNRGGAGGAGGGGGGQRRGQVRGH